MERLRVKSVLFDFDGVVVDSERLHIEAMLKTAADHSINLEEEVMHDFVGKSDALFYRYLIDEFDKNLDFDALTSYKNKLFENLIKNLQAVEGFVEFVEELVEKNIPRAIVTSSSAATLSDVVKIFPFREYIDVVVCEDDTNKHKPHPMPYLLAMERLGADADSSLVIEDSVSGVKAGKAAGCTVYALTTSLPADVLLGAGADRSFDSYASLREAVELIEN